MRQRLIKLPEKHSFFLFGPRGSGKTTLLGALPFLKSALSINLLKPDVESRFTRSPDSLEAVVKALPHDTRHIVIDEIQKVPKLLNMVHYLIEETDKYFILTGSSARRLKLEGANLLAGRAFVFDLFPFTAIELGDDFELINALSFGMLPKVWKYPSPLEKTQYLQAYAHTYLKEEIWAEHFVNALDPFRSFLEAAAQSNGKIINFANIARDVGVSDSMVQKYYTILEDTLMGFFLNPYEHSFRKRLSKKPKFYFFDTGVARALRSELTLPLSEKTSYFGELFEHFIILQCRELARYYFPEYRLSYLKTKDDAEIDLVVERPGQPLLLVEIKSSQDVSEQTLSTLRQFANELQAEAICLSQDPFAKQFDGVTVLPWLDGLKRYFTASKTLG